MDHLAAFGRQCLADDVAGAVLHFYGLLRGRLDDRLRDLTFCRQRLRHVQEMLEYCRRSTADGDGGPADAAWTCRRQPDAGSFDRVVLGIDPRIGHGAGGAAGRLEDLEQAAARVLDHADAGPVGAAGPGVAGCRCCRSGAVCSRPAWAPAT